MNKTLIFTSVIALAVASTGCATKKYVAKTMAPVEARVAGTEAKNADQDKTIAAQAKDIDTLQTNLSRTNEKVGDVDTKATAAGQAAQRAADAASGAQRSADGAKTAADGAMTAANTANTAAANAMTAVGTRSAEVERKVDSALKMTVAGNDSVLFAVNQSTLTKDAKAALDSFAAKAMGKDRFAIEVQGFTDKTGSAEGNAILSQRRAEAVARYLVNEHKIPVHQVTVLGSGYASPAGDDKTRDGRKANRRVEVRLFVPELVTVSQR